MRRVSYKAAQSLLALGTPFIIGYRSGMAIYIHTTYYLDEEYEFGCRYFYITS